MIGGFNQRSIFGCLYLSTISFQAADKKASKKLFDAEAPTTEVLQQQFAQYYDDDTGIDVSNSTLEDEERRRCFRGGWGRGRWGWGGGIGGVFRTTGGRNIFTYGGNGRPRIVVIGGGGGGVAPKAGGGGSPKMANGGGSPGGGSPGGDARRALDDPNAAPAGNLADSDAIDKQVNAESPPASKASKGGSMKRGSRKSSTSKGSSTQTNKKLMNDYYD